MNLHPTDILIRKTDGTETLWLSQRLVMEVCGIIEPYLRKKRNEYKKKGTRECDRAKAGDFMPKGEKAWRWAKTSNGFYYCLDNIPDRAPKYYRSMFGNPEELKALYLEQQNHREQTSLERDFKDFLKLNAVDYLHLYEGYNELQRRSLAKACAVVEFILHQKADYKGTKNKIYKDLAPILKAMNLSYIPHNPLRLKEKVEEAEARSIAISPRGRWDSHSLPPLATRQEEARPRGLRTTTTLIKTRAYTTYKLGRGRSVTFCYNWQGCWALSSTADTTA